MTATGVWVYIEMPIKKLYWTLFTEKVYFFLFYTMEAYIVVSNTGVPWTCVNPKGFGMRYLLQEALSISANTLQGEVRLDWKMTRVYPWVGVGKHPSPQGRLLPLWSWIPTLQTTVLTYYNWQHLSLLSLEVSVPFFFRKPNGQPHQPSN